MFGLPNIKEALQRCSSSVSTLVCFNFVRKRETEREGGKFALVTYLTSICWYSRGQAFEYRANAWPSFQIRWATYQWRTTLSVVKDTVAPEHLSERFMQLSLPAVPRNLEVPSKTLGTTELSPSLPAKLLFSGDNLKSGLFSFNHTRIEHYANRASQASFEVQHFPSAASYLWLTFEWVADPSDGLYHKKLNDQYSCLKPPQPS